MSFKSYIFALLEHMGRTMKSTQRRFDMTVKPIKTERDYQKALREIEKLWDAKPNTPKGDRLDVLVALVEAFERKHYEIAPPDPIEARSEERRVGKECRARWETDSE